MSSKVDESNVDGVIVISLGELPAECLIQKILNVENLPSPLVYKSINGYEWKVDTKYYSATVNLYCVPEKTEFDTDFCNKIQATLFYFNGKELSSFENVLSWIPLLKNISSEVQLLVCESCNDETRKNILNWCVENQYELVELNSEESDDEADDAIFSKSKGFGRVIEALQSHTWSNLIMKRTTNQEKQLTNDEKQNTNSNSDISSASSKQITETSKKMKVDDEELLLEEQWLQKVLEQDDPEGESFEALFSKFASMKEKASGLSGEERKKYAEKVAVAFWKAMGGEEDEIAGLDDD